MLTWLAHIINSPSHHVLFRGFVYFVFKYYIVYEIFVTLFLRNFYFFLMYWCCNNSFVDLKPCNFSHKIFQLQRLCLHSTWRQERLQFSIDDDHMRRGYFALKQKKILHSFLSHKISTFSHFCEIWERLQALKPYTHTFLYDNNKLNRFFKGSFSVENLKRSSTDLSTGNSN